MINVKMKPKSFCFAEIFLIFISFAYALPKFNKGRLQGGFLGAPRYTLDDPLPPDQWIVQRLDHFNDANTKTWKQRYFTNDAFYKPGGPVFLMIGGEGEASPKWMVTGAWIEYAKYFNALCFQVEHRFYGKSHPTDDMSTDNLQYLSSEQALADLAYFRNSKADDMKLHDAKWIAFGGSYPGSLAAWFRLKFPHLVDGSVATSAPIYAQLNFKDYLGVVRDALETTGPNCNPLITKAVQSVNTLISTESGRKELKDKFRLCTDIDVTNTNDVANLYSTLAGNFEGVCQYNKDNREFEGAVGTNVTIETLCGIMTKSGSPIDNYAKVNSLMLETYDTKCLDFKYDEMITELQAVTWESSASEGGRQWTYQTCTEFGYYQSSDLDQQPFGHKFPLSFSTQQCVDIFGEKFKQNFIQFGINRTNTNYGGRNLRVTKVVFPNGSIDPWHALGITNDISQDAPAIYIKGTAHCANMYPESADDLPQLKEARLTIRKLIGKWLN